MKNIIVVTGGAGFIGSNLIKLLVLKTNYRIISMDNYSTGSKRNHIKNKRVKYLRGENKNILAARRLAQRTVEAGASRLLHCSTALVAGSADENPVTEETSCAPDSPYQKIKLSVERELQENIRSVPLVIIRPTAIFGDGGKNLLKMVHGLIVHPLFYGKPKKSVTSNTQIFDFLLFSRQWDEFLVFDF